MHDLIKMTAGIFFCVTRKRFIRHSGICREAEFLNSVCVLRGLIDPNASEFLGINCSGPALYLSVTVQAIFTVSSCFFPKGVVY